mmetsp:Transcript_78478/g.243394  ORF Transcript_78478/g.243394 Transcript_78478/m.243394 type:complete len:89 (-) Transcript_78478:113-379(-)|eukprot:CAMPEP_0204597168 /NCGR_PEP_ID=MMETSP0661-20131031/53658_1 /ASSEMBLY_ACC=CAM_ASM_000606 /TAXON_ID=109239 /ORGANISM="Alexandrium margalefi, Strain AMGDE01CS-322" /LENGTH=88 /DNA_ID=CAMNT_0051607847 /DNA_START=78 /DNA_END=344 /DNA_ORIENTATION=-
MQQPGESVSKLARQQSAGALVARLLARSRGLPVPLAAQGPAKSEGTGQGWTMLRDYPYMTNGNALVCIFMPLCGSVGFCVTVCRYLIK